MEPNNKTSFDDITDIGKNQKSKERNKKDRRIAIWLIACLLILAMPGFLGFRWNRTPSFPVGLYHVVNKKAEKGDLVKIQAPRTPVMEVAIKRGYIGRDEWLFLLKRVVATGGDEISVGPEGVFVNRQFIANSKPLTKDSQGRPMPEGWHRTKEGEYNDHYVLTPYEVFLMSDYNAASWDSRYFGPVTRDIVDAGEVVKPVFTF